MPIHVTAENDEAHRSARICPSGEFKALPKPKRVEITDQVISGLPRHGGARLASIHPDHGVLNVDHTDPHAVETVRAWFEELCRQEEALVPQPGPVDRVLSVLKWRMARFLNSR